MTRQMEFCDNSVTFLWIFLGKINFMLASLMHQQNYMHSLHECYFSSVFSVSPLENQLLLR